MNASEYDLCGASLSKKSYAEMLAEALREIGVLTLVFALLDRIVAGRITVSWTLMALSISVASFLLGCVLERMRPDA